MTTNLNNTIALTFCDAAEWHGLIRNQRHALQQAAAYGQTMQSYGARVRHVLILSDDECIGGAQIIERRFYRAVTVASLFRGPVWCQAPPDPEIQLATICALKALYLKRRGDFFLVMPEQEAGTRGNKLLKQAGLHRIVSGYSTIWLDLTKDPEILRAELSSKWRNALSGSESKGLEISIGGRKRAQYLWLLEQESAQRSRIRYQGLPPDLVSRFAEVGNQNVVVISALDNRDRIAGALFLISGVTATYQVGWAGRRGRDLNAQNLVLWHAILALRERGVRHLDLGGFNTAVGAGVARFKLGIGGSPITLCGTWF